MGLRRLAISNPSANTDTTILTSDNQYLVSIISANKSTSSASTIRVWVEPSGSTNAAQYAYIVYDIPVDQSNSYETFRFAVNQNDVIKVRANSANISFQVYGLVQYDVNLGVGISSYKTDAPANPVDGMIWVDSDGISGTSAKPAYVYSLATTSWIPLVGGINTAANYVFSGTVVIPGYEKEIPLQATAPISATSSDLWIDSSVPAAPQLKVYNGSAWVSLSSAVDNSDLVLSQRMFMS